MFVRFLLVLGLLTLIAGASYGDCYTNRSYSPYRYYSTYSAPIVATEYIEKQYITPIPIIVPAFTFQYSPPCATAPVVQAPVAQQGQNTASYSAPTVNTGVQSNELREFARMLVEEIRRTNPTSSNPSKEQAGDDGPPAYKADQPSQSQPTQPPQPPRGAGESQQTGGNGRPSPQSKYAQAAVNAFSRNCASCHTGSGSKSDMVIFSQQDVFNPEAPFGSMLKQIEQGRMPPKDSQWQPTQEEKTAMVAFLKGQ